MIGPLITIHQGSILDFEGDVIVNPANNFLQHGGGLAAFIAKAAAPWDHNFAYWGSEEHAQAVATTEWQEEQRNHPLIATGAAGWTSAGALPYKGIVHAVGPIWEGGGFLEEDLLELVHEHALMVAEEHECRSIAFPAISCGIFGFPVEKAAPIAIEVAKWGKYYNIDHVAFYLFEDTHYFAYKEALK